MSASDYLEAAVLDHVFGRAAYTVPGNLYIALYTAAPSDSGGGTQVSGNAYARVSVANNATTWARTVSVLSNAIAITFPTPTPSAWGTVTHFGVFDAASAGNLLGWAALTTPRVTAAGVPLSFAVGDLAVTAT